MSILTMHSILCSLKKHLYTISAAEATLAAEEPRPQFSINLLHLVQGDAAAVAAGLDNAVRFAAVVYFKNFVKKYWKMVSGINSMDCMETISFFTRIRDAECLYFVDVFIFFPSFTARSFVINQHFYSLHLRILPTLAKSLWTTANSSKRH